MTSVKILIYGKVQGVAFRYHIKELASTLGVNGWVRNRVDGSVEAFFQGEIHLVNQLIDWCHKGPDEALVEKLISHNPLQSQMCQVLSFEPLAKHYLLLMPVLEINSSSI